MQSSPTTKFSLSKIGVDPAQRGRRKGAEKRTQTAAARGSGARAAALGASETRSVAYAHVHSATSRDLREAEYPVTSFSERAYWHCP